MPDTERLQFDFKGLPEGTVHSLKLIAFDRDQTLTAFVRELLEWTALHYYDDEDESDD